MPHLSTAERIGRKGGKREFLFELLEYKFGPLSDAATAKIARLSEPKLRELSRLVLTATTLEELELLP